MVQSSHDNGRLEKRALAPVEQDVRIFTSQEAQSFGFNPNFLYVPLGMPLDLSFLRRGIGNDIKQLIEDKLHNATPGISPKIAVPVIMRSNRGEDVLVVLGACDIANQQALYPQSYYKQFEDNTAAMRLIASLGIYSPTSEMRELIRNHQGIPVHVLLLGNAFTGNITGVRNFLEAKGVVSHVTVMDINPIPLNNLVNSTVLQSQDIVIQGDITKSQNYPPSRTDVMFADCVLNCMSPSRLAHFFETIRTTLDSKAVLFMSVLTHQYFERYGLEELSSTFHIRTDSSNEQTQYIGTSKLYQALAQASGLRIREIGIESVDRNSIINKSYYVITS